MPDRKFTPSGDKPFENGMNSLRFLRVCSMWWAKVNFASRNNPRYFATRTQGTGWPKIWTGVKPTGSRGLRVNMRQSTFTGINFYFPVLSSANIAKCDRSVCGISFTYRVNNRGELKLPCGRPLLIGRGEESVLSTLTRNERSERKL
ncbi:hypothetical protein TNCV_2375261 [Trichonephila clavipes]|nr:hypothetical protein TNCV_2375261 [Trichonephila clavipes]